MKKKIIIAGLGMLPWLASYAQQQDTTLVRTVVVENQYNPTVMDASKINVLPKVEEPTVPKAHIDYANSVRPVASWASQSMNPIVRDWTPDAAYRGYLRAGYGNNGNVDARLGYLWDISKKDRLEVQASLDGWNGEVNGWNASNEEWSGEKWTSRLYNTKLGVDFKHSFKKMDFSLGGNLHSRVFNHVYNEGRQHQTFANAYIGFASTDEGMPIQFEAQAGLRLYDEKYPKVDPYDELEKETNIFITGNVWKSLSEGKNVGLGLNFDNYAHSPIWADDVMAIDFNPYYTIQNDDWKVRLGAHLDWIGIDEAFSEDNDNQFYVSPDVNIEYIFSDSYVLYGKAGGGRSVSSFYDLMETVPYFKERKIKPTYMNLDAAVGLKASPANGWWFHLASGYQIRKNDVCLYLYPMKYSDLYRGPKLISYEGNTKVFYATAELKHNYKDLWDFSLKSTYYHWNWEENSSDNSFVDLASSSEAIDALVLKPELEIIGEVGFKPVQGLRINAGYEYVKRAEEIYEPISNLYAGADYALMKNLGIFVKVNNLLNKEYVRVDAYPAQKLNFLAGLSLQF